MVPNRAEICKKTRSAKVSQAVKRYAVVIVEPQDAIHRQQTLLRSHLWEGDLLNPEPTFVQVVLFFPLGVRDELVRRGKQTKQILLDPPAVGWGDRVDSGVRTGSVEPLSTHEAAAAETPEKRRKVPQTSVPPPPDAPLLPFKGTNADEREAYKKMVHHEGTLVQIFRQTNRKYPSVLNV